MKTKEYYTAYRAANLEKLTKYNHQYHQDNKKRRALRTYARRKRLFEEIVVPVKDRPCMDCGGKFPLICMQFDHVRGKKLFMIRVGVGCYSREKIIEEMAKCDIVCANCHWIRTENRINERKKLKDGAGELNG